MNKNMKFVFIIGFFVFDLFVFSSCAFLASDCYCPRKYKIIQIENKLYHSKLRNCAHKSIMLHNYYKKHNIKSRIICGSVKGYSNYHAWVEVYNSETKKWHLIDPTWKKEIDGKPINFYKNRKPILIYPGYINTHAELIELFKKCLDSKGIHYLKL